MRKPGLRIILWAAAAVAVTAVASLAISASVGASVNPLTPEDVARQLDDTPTGAPGGLPSVDGEFGTAAPTGPAGANSVVFTSPAGTVVATCDGGLASLVSWTPNPGYRVDHVSRGPAAVASAEFESDTAIDVRVDVDCNGPTPGVPRGAFAAERDDHGGNRGPGGGDDHGGGGNSGPGGGGSGSSGRDHPEDD